MDVIKRCFFEETLRHWHFEDILIESGLSRERTNHYLKQLCDTKFITRIKPRGKMPYYLAQHQTPLFRIEKRLFGLHLLEKSGLFQHIYSCDGIQTAILFGSFARGDFGKSSDVDLFFYGKDDTFNKIAMEQKIGRTIQLFNYEFKSQLRNELEPSLLPNIIKGFNIKGTLEPFEVIIHA